MARVKLSSGDKYAPWEEVKSTRHGLPAGGFGLRPLDEGERMSRRPAKRKKIFRYPSGGGDNLHRVVAERALGKPLRKGIEVHHVNQDESDASPGNLVICDSLAYHRLLHIRQRALDACGNANWRKCYICKQHDDPANLRIVPKAKHHNGQPVHGECVRANQRAWHHSKKARGEVASQ